MAKLYATVNHVGSPIILERSTTSATWSLLDRERPDLVKTGPGRYSLVLERRSVQAFLLKADHVSNIVRVRIGAHTYVVRLETERQQLIHDELSLDRAANAVVQEIKAPMPGLILKLLVKEGDAVTKNDPVLILEAMKMENVIKSPGEGRVLKMHAQERVVVEKGELLVSFE